MTAPSGLWLVCRSTGELMFVQWTEVVQLIKRTSAGSTLSLLVIDTSPALVRASLYLSSRASVVSRCFAILKPGLDAAAAATPALPVMVRLGC